MISPRRIKAVATKELQELMRNAMSFILTIVAPIILYFLFAFGMPLDVKNIPMAVLDEDKSAESRRLINTFESANIFHIDTMIDKFKDIETILKRGEIRLCVVIPSRFSEKIQKGVPQAIYGYVDATYPNRAQMIGGYFEGTIADYNSMVMSRFFLKVLGPSYGTGTGMPVSVYISPWFNPTYKSEDFIVPGVIAIILIFLPPTIAAISLSKEKETGSILNMFCSPITKTEYIIGKSLPYIVLTYCNFLLFLALTVFLFKVPMRGDLLLLLGVSFIYVVIAIGLGMLVAVPGRTQIAAILITAILNLIPTFMYSGFMNPIICMDESGKETAYSLPTTYYISFIRKLMLKSVSIEYLSTEIIVLSVMAFSFYAVSIVLFKKKLG